MCAVALCVSSTLLLPTALADDAVAPKDPGPQSGSGIQPIWLPGLPTCAQLAPEGLVWRELVAGAATGSYGGDLLTVAVELERSMGGQVLAWQADLAPSAVLVRSVNDTNLYRYDVAVPSLADTLLHAPVDPNVPSFLPVASVSFCYQTPPEDPGVPSANGMQPVWQPAGPSCDDLAPAGTVWRELRVEPVADGAFEDADLAVSIDRLDTMGGQGFDWRANVGVDAIIVRDGLSSNLYTYNPPVPSRADSGLHAPVDPNTYLPRRLSSVSFCYQVQPPDPGPPSQRGVQPVWQPGSPSCAELAPEGTTWQQHSIGQPVASGTSHDALLSVELVRHDLMAGRVYDWTANLAVDAVLVRADGGTNVYPYNPPAAARADQQLHAPVDPTMVLQRASEIAFCYQVPPQDPGPVSGSGVQPVWRDNVPDCATIAPAGADWHQLTVESVADGSFGDGYLNVAVDHERPLEGDVIGWSSNVSVSAVLVHGGGNSNLYTYSESPAWHDTLLHAPVDPGTYLFHRIDQLAFCYQRGPEDPGPSSGQGTQPVWKPGDSSCADLAPGDTTWRELRIEPVGTGTFGDGLLAVALENRREMGGQSVNWSANLGVDAVFVKGELNSNLYRYGPPAEVSADTFLHAPVDAQLALQEISYLAFCYDVDPSIAVELSGDTLGKAGDEVTYSVHILNDGDVPLSLAGVSDALLGDLTAYAEPAGCGNLAPGASCQFQVSRIVQAGDADPLSATTSATYSLGGTSETVSAWDEHATELFQPRVDVAVVGPDRAPWGDEIEYTVTLANHSSADTPSLFCTASSSLAGSLFDGKLPSGDTALHLSYTPQPGDPDPLHDTVTLSCSPDGFPNTLQVEASWSVDLYRPLISLNVLGEALAQAGQPVNYQLELRNESSPDAPPLECLLVDTATGLERQVTLASGRQDVSLVPYLIPETAPDPLVNTVTASCLPHGGSSPLIESASWSIELFQARVALYVTGDAFSQRGGVVDYQVVLENHSSADAPPLDCALSEELLRLSETVTLLPGESYVATGAYQVPDDAADPLTNIAVVACTPLGFAQQLVAHASHTTRLFEPAIELTKSGSVLSGPGEKVGYTIMLRNASSPDTPELECSISDPLLHVEEQVALASGEEHTISVFDHVVPLDAQGAYTNTATALCESAGLPAMEAQATWVTALYHPALTVSKNGPAHAEVGEKVVYSFVIENTSTDNTPPLELIEVVDDKLGDLTQMARDAGCATLLPGAGASCQFIVRHTVQPGDELGRDPSGWPILVNTVSVRYCPQNASLPVEGSDTHTLRLVHPGPGSPGVQGSQASRTRDLARPRR